MTLLLTGQTSDELLGSKGSGQSSVMNEAANEFLQSQLSNSLTQALRGTGFINKAEVELTEGGIEEANVKLYGNLAFLGDVEWSFGSNVADVGDSEFSVTLPLSTIFQPEIFNNFIIQFSKFANSEQVYKTNQKDWEIKIKWGKSF